MKGTLIIYRRELAGLFLTPLAWVLLAIALAFHGLYFIAYLQGTQGDVDAALGLSLGGGFGFWVLLIFLPPLLTMRMISEEARNGMLEFLLTSPIKDGAVVLGKALAATTFCALLWSSTVVYALVLEFVGGDPDWGQLIGSLLGAILVSGLFCATGLVASALSGIPILAAFLAMVMNVVLVTLPFFRTYAVGGARDLYDAVLERVNLIAHLQGSFVSGAFDTADAAFFLVWTAVALFLATRLVEAKRWR